MSKSNYNPDEHLVDILEPPTYLPSGKTQGIVQAIRSGAWLHTADVWVYRTEPSLQILFQQRRPDSPTHAGKLDCSVAGYLEAGETPVQGALREMHEELGIRASIDQLIPIGRRLNAMIDHRGRERHIVANSHIYHSIGQADDMKVNPDEVYAVFWIPADGLMKVFTGESINIHGLNAHGEELEYLVSKDNFVYNVDEYHLRVAERLQCMHISNKL